MKHRSTWRAPVDHPAYLGHFPGTPVVPSVMLLDAVLHAISGGLGAGRSEVRSLEFLGPVQPGDSVVIEHEPTDDGAIRFEVKCDTHSVATGVIVMGIAA